MTSPNPMLWGERGYLLAKSLTYVFSLDLHFELDRGEVTEPCPVPLRAKVFTYGSDIYHVLGDRFVTLPDRGRHEVPSARLLNGDDALASVKRGAVPLDGRLLFETDTMSLLTVSYTGVLTMRNGTDAMGRARSETGTCFISMRSEIDAPKYRWLLLNQLIGFGTATAECVGDASKWTDLTLSFDLYLSA